MLTNLFPHYPDEVASYNAPLDSLHDITYNIINIKLIFS